MEKNEMTTTQIIDELTYINYKANRERRPDITPEKWAKIYPNVKLMEIRFQYERGDK
jgi:hypothetical protein